MRNPSYHNQTPIQSKFDWRTIFLKNSGGFSSKRLLSIIGFLTCICIFIAAFILDKEVPEYGDILLICSVSLFGIEVLPTFNSLRKKSIDK
jgi:hypothetical protein